MERYERYRKYKFSKAFNAKMNTLTFVNLHASVNDGDIMNVQIVHHRHENLLLINRYALGFFGVVIYLNQATINSDITDEVLIEYGHEQVRIIFSTPEERLFFLNEIQSVESSSSSESSNPTDEFGN